MPQLTAYLSFDGNCAEAMRFYAKVLGGELKTLLSYGASPMGEQCKPGDRDRIMHAYLEHPAFAIMGGDATSDMPYTGVQGVSMTLNYDTVAEARRVFDALSQGGKVTMPMSETFWADAFGMFNDRFGVPWIVNGGMRPLASS